MDTPAFSPSLEDLFPKLANGRAAVVDRSARGLLRLTGDDRVRFLNGMVTNDVAKLAPGHTCPALLLDRKGHVLAQIDVLAFEEELWIGVAARAEDLLTETLDRHIIADDVEIDTLSDQYIELGVEGPGAAEALHEAGLDMLPRGRCARDRWRTHEVVVVGGGAYTDEGARLIAPRGSLSPLRDDLEVDALSDEETEILRVETFRPKLDVDVSERNFPQEARLDDAVSFTKGCYIGQEIVARIQSRGAVNRLLVKLAAQEPVSVGDEIAIDGRVSGAVTSAVVSPQSGPLALGYVKASDAEPGTEVTIAGTRALVLGPPLST